MEADTSEWYVAAVMLHTAAAVLAEEMDAQQREELALTMLHIAEGLSQSAKRILGT